jgi:phenylalanyl-tRNA synthetase beta chain
MPGTPLTKVMGLDDVIIDIDNKSINHRPDLWGHYGIAREVAAILGKKLKKYDAGRAKLGAGNYPITIKDKNCHRYAGVLIKNVTVEPSPKWLQEKLIAVGQRPINNMVDITNYVMFDLGKPIHAFDADKIEGHKIVVRKAKNREKFPGLDGQDYQLDDSIVVISDAKKAVALAGIIGGANSEVDEKSQNILIETASFDAACIRKTSTKLGLRTEASMRFEKALDPELVPISALKAVSMVLELCPGAQVVTKMVDIKNYQKRKTVIQVTPDFINQRIGKSIKPAVMKNILQSLEFKVDSRRQAWRVEVPSFRATKDISIPDDLVEEVARIYGYDNIEPKMPAVLMETPFKTRERDFEHRLKKILSWELGFDEVYNYSFMSDEERKIMEAREERVVKVMNSLSPEQSFLRSSLIPGILQNIQKNQNNFSHIKIFELGRIYLKINGLNSNGEKLPEEAKKITGAIVSDNEPELAFRQAKGLLELLFQRLRALDQVRFTPLIAGSALWQRGATTNIEINKKVVGQLGFINQKIAASFGLKSLPVVFNLDFKNLIESLADKFSYQSLPRFPSIELDLSLVVEKKIYWQQIENLIKGLKSAIIKEVKLFDVYQGKNIGENKRSLAFRIIYQAEDRTLTLEEAKVVQQEVVELLKQKFGAEVRGA